VHQRDGGIQRLAMRRFAHLHVKLAETAEIIRDNPYQEGKTIWCIEQEAKIIKSSETDCAIATHVDYPIS
jgi:hypothetical protein